MSLALFRQILTVMIAKKSKRANPISVPPKWTDERRKAFFQINILLLGSLFLLIIEYSSAKGGSETSSPIHDKVMDVSSSQSRTDQLL